MWARSERKYMGSGKYMGSVLMHLRHAPFQEVIQRRMRKWIWYAYRYTYSEGKMSSSSVRTGCVRRHLKVLSGQIRSAWEWYLWIGLDKDINRFWFLNVYLEFLKIIKSSEPLHTKIHLISSFFGKQLVYRILSSSICWRTFIRWKNLSIPYLMKNASRPV